MNNYYWQDEKNTYHVCVFASSLKKIAQFLYPFHNIKY